MGKGKREPVRREDSSLDDGDQKQLLPPKPVECFMADVAIASGNILSKAKPKDRAAVKAQLTELKISSKTPTCCKTSTCGEGHCSSKVDVADFIDVFRSVFTGF